MRMKKDWWRNFFNEIYLITDARSICNSSLTCREVDLIEKILDLDKSDRILDLCGGYGRHSLELARRGYCDLTVLDLSDYQIKLGKSIARKENLNVKFIRKDARSSGLKANNYSIVFIMANSFGYFQNKREDLRILKEIHRLLKKDGRLLLDLTDPDYARKNLKPISWHQADEDIIVCRKRELKRDMLKAREIVLSKRKGLLRDELYCERIYHRSKITRLLKNTGFKNLSIKRNLSLHKYKKDYGLLTSRMIVAAEKS